MARKRMLDPGIWADEGFIELSANARLLWIGLISMADDEGKGLASLKSLKAMIFPADELNLTDIQNLKNEVKDKMQIAFYTTGKEYYKLLNWKKHQTINRPTKSTIPEPNESFNDQSMNDHGILNESSRPREEKEEKEINLNEEKEREKGINNKPFNDQSMNECEKNISSSPSVSSHNIQFCDEDLENIVKFAYSELSLHEKELLELERFIINQVNDIYKIDIFNDAVAISKSKGKGLKYCIATFKNMVEEKQGFYQQQAIDKENKRQNLNHKIANLQDEISNLQDEIDNCPECGGTGKTTIDKAKIQKIEKLKADLVNEHKTEMAERIKIPELGSIVDCELCSSKKKKLSLELFPKLNKLKEVLC